MIGLLTKPRGLIYLKRTKPMEVVLMERHASMGATDCLQNT